MATGLIFDCSSEWLAIERLATEFPRHVPTLMANAVIAYDERDKVKAKRYLDALFSVTESHPDAAVLRSRVAIDQGNMPLARRVIETQLAYTPNEASVHEAYSSILYMLRDLDGAAREIGLAEKLGAPGWRVAYNRGLIAEAAGRPQDAQRMYQTAVDGNPDFAPARARLTSARSGS
jgi:Flp pilus assembly protein TadD